MYTSSTGKISWIHCTDCLTMRSICMAVYRIDAGIEGIDGIDGIDDIDAGIDAGIDADIDAGIDTKVSQLFRFIIDDKVLNRRSVNYFKYSIFNTSLMNSMKN